MSVKENLTKLKSELPPQVTLVAVSKTKPPALVMEAYDAGQRHFGENYVQELADKHSALPKDICWHFIGHLQSNKVKFIAPFVHLIHGVDSLKLLQEIDKQAKKNGRTIACLLQVYIATEETKFGLSGDECEQILSSEELKKMTNTHIIGFMAMASNTASQQQQKKEFSAVKDLFDRMKNEGKGLSVLSTGMSGDYRTAIECGSTMVRIGSLIFGSRNNHEGPQNTKEH